MLNRNLLTVVQLFLFFCNLILSPVSHGSAQVINTNTEEDVLRYTNQFRKSKGMLPLELSTDLSAIARKHSADMAAGRKSLGHGGFKQREVLIRRKLKTTGPIGENVAFGAASGREAVTLWKNSSAHRRNMLGNYKFIGIGVARNRSGQIYFTQIFVR